MSNTETSTVPAVKKQGPIRHGSVVPTLILALICLAFFKFVLDYAIKRGAEWALTHAQGAEVDVGSVHTSVLHGSFTLNKLQVTDKQNPSQNILQIGQIRFAFSWDALLRLKFVVTDAGIDGISVYVPRSHRGWVQPPKPISTAPAPADEPSTLDSIQDSINKQVQGSGPKDPLGGLAKLFAGTSQADLIKNAQATLKSEVQIKALQTEVQEKQKEWREKIAKLPQQKDFDAIIQQAKTLKFDLSKPQELASNLQKAKELKDQADVKLKEIKSTTDGIKADIDHLNTEYKGIDKLVLDDIKAVQGGLNIADLNVKDLSRAVFANFLAQKLGSYAKYLALAEKYTSNSKKNKTAQKNDLIPPKRGAGRTYRFAITTLYPLFWLQKATISSKATDQGFSGNINGALTNLTTDPEIVGQPAILDVKGDFPKQNVSDTELKVVLNHVQNPSEDTFAMRVGSYPVQNFSLADSSDLKLGIEEARGSAAINGVYKDGSINFSLNNEYKNCKYLVDAGGGFKDALTSVLNGIPNVSVKASAQGPLNALQFDVDSNLGEQLAEGLKKYLQDKIDVVQKQIKDEIDSRIDGPKKDLENQMQQATGVGNSEIKTENQTAASAGSAVKSSTKSSGGGSIQDQLLKNLHF